MQPIPHRTIFFILSTPEISKNKTDNSEYHKISKRCTDPLSDRG